MSATNCGARKARDQNVADVKSSVPNAAVLSVITQSVSVIVEFTMLPGSVPPIDTAKAPPSVAPQHRATHSDTERLSVSRRTEHGNSMEKTDLHATSVEAKRTLNAGVLYRYSQ